MPAGVKGSDCLREYQTGGLRRMPGDKPVGGVVLSGRPPQREKENGQQPALQPPYFIRPLGHAALPLGVGVIADTFMGSGSTIAAAEAVGVASVGVERYADYYRMSREAIPKLAAIQLPKEEVEEQTLFTL